MPEENVEVVKIALEKIAGRSRVRDSWRGSQALGLTE